MAQRTVTTLVDDIDGGAADESVTFSLDGVAYEIDLSSAHATELREAFAAWVSHARKVSGRSTARGGSSRRQRTSDAQAVRDWANANGHPVSERGRIPAAVQDAYAAAH